MTMIALPPTTSPDIVCPSWCVVTKAEHVADLRNLEGYVIHWSADQCGVKHSRAAYVDNTEDPTDPPLVYAAATDGMELAQAERMAQQILAAVAEARS